MSAEALAAHSSQGMNMIAINNQSLAASLQVHNSSLVLAYYGGLVRAMFYGLDDSLEDIAK